MKRVFLAISFKDNSFLTQYINDIKANLLAENIKWAEADNIHLTLKFFGPTSDLSLEQIKSSLDKALKSQKSFTISFNKLGVFGSRYQPRVLWMGMGQGDKLQSLEQEISQVLAEIDISGNRQNFVPHLTIARIKKLNSKKYFQSVVQRYKDFDSGEIAIESIFLYQSILHKEGPEYRVLQEYRLL
jgi:2'-5' RNA ligase